MGKIKQSEKERQQYQTELVRNLREERGQLIDERDGLQMRLQAHEAKINAQIKKLELISRELLRRRASQEAWKEIAHEFMNASIPAAKDSDVSAQ